MGKKESLQKEIDSLLDKMKFWRSVTVSAISGIIGIIFAISQNKLIVNNITNSLIISGIFLIIVSLKFMYNREQERIELVKKLEKED